MPAGEPERAAVAPAQAALVRAAVAEAERRTGLRFLVHVGPSVAGDPAAEAARLLAGTGDERGASVAVHVDPTLRRVEVVTGTLAARRLSDRDCALAALSMATSFAGGDLAGGLAVGVRMLADHAG